MANHSPNRRKFLLGAGATTGALAVSSLVWRPRPNRAAEASRAIAPEAALEELLKGNDRYVSGKTHKHDFQADRQSLVESQHPIAVVLSCSDSRVVPQFAFDQGPGRLFVVRVAGNVVNANGLASIEYAVKFLKTPLLMVLGHSSCGAVDAAIKVVNEGAELPGRLPGLVDAIRRAVKAAGPEKGDLLANATRQNVRLNVQDLRNSKQIVGPLVEKGSVKIVGGAYDLATGRVALVD